MVAPPRRITIDGTKTRLFSHVGMQFYYSDKSEASETCKAVVVVVVTQPLSRDGGMAEEHGAPEAGQLPKAWIRGRK